MAGDPSLLAQDDKKREEGYGLKPILLLAFTHELAVGIPSGKASRFKSGQAVAIQSLLNLTPPPINRSRAPLLGKERACLLTQRPGREAIIFRMKIERGEVVIYSSYFCCRRSSRGASFCCSKTVCLRRLLLLASRIR